MWRWSDGSVRERRETDALNTDPLSRPSISSQSAWGAELAAHDGKCSRAREQDGWRRSRWMAGQLPTNPSPSVLTPQSLCTPAMHTDRAEGLPGEMDGD